MRFPLIGKSRTTHIIPVRQDNKVPTAPIETRLPIAGGRQTVVTGGKSTLYSVLRDEIGEMTPDFEIELLNVCYFLAKYNGDVSYAVDNIVQLGNTPETVTFDDGGSGDREKDKERLSFLKAAERSIYNGGMNSLQNDLLAQVAITGALSAEMVPTLSIDAIDDIPIVDPYYIRFKTINNKYVPFQKPPMLLTDVLTGGLKQLNPVTYRYLALRRYRDSPYAIPPFISAFESIELEKEMVRNMRFIIKKLGLFGFLSLMVTPPTRKQGESEDAYFLRSQNYLKSLKPIADEGYSNGMMIGFKNQQEIKLEAANTNLSGAEAIFNLVMQMKSAGLKQDPLMLGRNFNVAETMARVIMAKLTTQIGNFQRLVATFRADLYLMMLTIAGDNIRGVTVEYDQPMIGDKLRDEQAFEKKVANRKVLRDSGVISQQDMANELGYEKPHAEKEVDYTVPHADIMAAKAASKPDPKRDPNQASDPTASGSTDYNMLFLSLHRDIAEYVYKDDSCKCGHNSSIRYAGKRTGMPNNIDDFIALYHSDIGRAYEDAVNSVTDEVGTALIEMGEAATAQQITDRIFTILYSHWANKFTKKATKLVNNWVDKIYTYFRKDTSYFPTDFDVPKATLGIRDVRTIEYFSNSDRLYLGKFVTDSDTRKRFTDFINKYYIENNNRIGNNPEAIAKFQEAFGDTVLLEAWKIRRIIDTTVNSMRNYASVAYMNEAGIQQFEIVGVQDERQCGYCASLQGKRFDVVTAFNRTDKIVQGLPEFANQDKPFVTTLFKGADGLKQFEDLEAAEIQQLGIDVPPYHPSCRDIIIAVI